MKSIFSGDKSGRTGNRSTKGDILILVFLILTSGFMALPFAYSLIQSLKPIQELFIFPPRFYVRNPTFNNYLSLIQYTSNMGVPFLRYLFNSVFVTVTATFFQIITCSMAAFVLSKGRFKYKKVIFTIIVSTLLFSADVLGIPNFVVVSQLRLINTYFAIILPAIAVPLGAFLMKQFMETNIPDTLIESARIDGATVWAIFWKLVMPLVKPAWLTLIIFSFQQIWTREGLQFIYNESLKVLPTMFRQIIAAGVGRSDLAAAATVLIIIPPIIAFVIAQSRVLETMANSGIK